MKAAKTNTAYGKRVLSLLMCFVIFLHICPSMALSGAKTVTVTHEGREVQRLFLPINEKKQLTAEYTQASSDTAYQWQILADPAKETWVNIYDGTESRLNLSYAMVQSLLDESGSTYIRCRAGSVSDECLSAPVCVTVEYTASSAAGAAVQSVSALRQASGNAAAAVQDDTEGRLVRITVNYLDGVSGMPIYSPYTGTVDVSAAAYEATVISPVYIGYAPYYSKNNPAAVLPQNSGEEFSKLFPDNASVIRLNIPTDYAQPQYVVNVYYTAINVPYAVRYYFQNIFDDMYTENIGLYKTDSAKTGTIISEEKLTESLDPSAIAGFSKFHHTPEAVAADGSTVFECYYDRNYYMLKFDLNGGYGVEPVYARYGTPFTVNTPTRHGYVFAGWELLDAEGSGSGRAESLPAEIPAQNRTYRAMWEAADCKYSVVYWLRNADNDEYAYIGTVKMEAKADTVITPGDTDKCPPLTSELIICGNEEADHVHDLQDCQLKHADRYQFDAENPKNSISVKAEGNGSTVINVYYTRKYYTLRFIYAKETQGSSGQEPTYSVVGGSTYGFGNVSLDSAKWFDSHQKYKLNELLAHVDVFDKGEKWGEIKALPKLNDPEGAHYQTGVYPQEEDGVKVYNDSGERYHYFEITAKYGADLTNLWPVDGVFGEVLVKDPQKHTANGAYKALDGKDGTAGAGWGNRAYLAGWNGEYKVAYSIIKANSTVKGLYQKLDDMLLLGEYNGTKYGYADEGDGIDRIISATPTAGGEKVSSNVCYFLAFFDNGANVNWSVPRKWIYESFVPVFSHEVPENSELYTAIMKAADNSDTAKRTYTDPVSGNVYYYFKNNKQIYRLYDSIVANDDNRVKDDSDSGQTQTVLRGFEAEDREGYKRYEQFYNGELNDRRLSYTSRFFYKRDNFTFALHNHGKLYKKYSAEFDSAMDDYLLEESGAPLVPEFPDTLEAGAYYFDGWYLSPECVEGTEYRLGQGYKMPATDISLYAKWTPVTRTVRFFRTYDDLRRYEKYGDISGLIDIKYVGHGQTVDNIEDPTDETSGHNYSFGGWFLEYAGKRYAYNPLDVPIVRDINVFASWGSFKAQPYRIQYALDDPETDEKWKALLPSDTDGLKDNAAFTVTDGTQSRKYIFLESDGGFHLSIAEDSGGFAYEGSTRTFVPKIGDPYGQLYDGYNKKYYPTLASHSMVIKEENAENRSNPQENVFTFTYVHADRVDYAVEYRYADTNKLIESAPGNGRITKTTEDAVVTERFAAVKNYVPDAFFKRLIIAVEKSDDGTYAGASSNVIVFYYSPNTAGARYAVHYMLQNPGAGSDYTQENGSFVNYTEASAYTEGIGNIGSICSIPPQTFSGFTVLDPALTDGGAKAYITEDADGRPCFNITVSENGTELYIFYKRNTQQYKVYYLQYGVADIGNLASLTPSSEGVLGIKGPEDAQFGATVTVGAESFGGMTCISALTQSMLVRADDKQNYIIFYYMPMQTTIEYRVWQYGGGTLDTTLEVFKGLPSRLNGSKPEALEGYIFQGWYLDPECTKPVKDSGRGTVEVDNRLLPNNNMLEEMPSVNVFYAKFLPDNGELIITRKNGQGDQSSGKQVFVYKIQADNDPNYVIYVTITGSGSVTVKDLPCRGYTVEQQNGWSWRYDDQVRSVTVTKDGKTAEAVFDKEASAQNWLNGNSERITNRKG